jgi:pimeloyl-ACP methyl ester carboxylesterase
MTRWCLAFALAFASLWAQAQGVVHTVATREGVSTTVFWLAAASPKATVLLFPGGGGGFGKVEAGVAGSRNFLVRAAPLFVAQGYNVAIFGKPSDRAELDYPDRITDAHMADIAQVLAFVRTLSPLPVWLVGTSRGTVSATAAAIRLHDPALAGLVLSSSVVNGRKAGAVPTQDLAAITLPVLLLHHEKDACNVCSPADVPLILKGLTHAAVKKLVWVNGGTNPSGEACGALHWHGYIGMEAEAVGVMAGWIAKPVD